MRATIKNQDQSINIVEGNNSFFFPFLENHMTNKQTHSVLSTFSVFCVKVRVVITKLSKYSIAKHIFPAHCNLSHVFDVVVTIHSKYFH